MASRQQPLVFRGYTKKARGQWVAVCIDLNIVAQGSSPSEATGKCGELISEFIDYVCSEYSHDIGRYLFRPVPREFIEEYENLVGRNLQQKPARSKQLYNFSIEPVSPACSPA